MGALGWSRVFGFYLLMLVVGAAGVWANGGWVHLVPAMNAEAWAVALLLGLGTGLVVVAGSRMANRFAWGRRLSDEFRALLGELSGREALLVALLSGVGEEVLFRGVLQPALGLWIAAAIFGLLHMGPNPRFIPWTITAFGAGLLFGEMFIVTGNLVAPILAHMTINYLNLRYLAAPTYEPIELGVAHDGVTAVER